MKKYTQKIVWPLWMIHTAFSRTRHFDVNNIFKWNFLYLGLPMLFELFLGHCCFWKKRTFLLRIWANWLVWIWFTALLKIYWDWGTRNALIATIIIERIFKIQDQRLEIYIRLQCLKIFFEKTSKYLCYVLKM